MAKNIAIESLAIMIARGFEEIATKMLVHRVTVRQSSVYKHGKRALKSGSSPSRQNISAGSCD